MWKEEISRSISLDSLIFVVVIKRTEKNNYKQKLILCNPYENAYGRNSAEPILQRIY